jgi:hypothetical protein
MGEIKGSDELIGEAADKAAAWVRDVRATGLSEILDLLGDGLRAAHEERRAAGGGSGGEDGG